MMDVKTLSGAAGLYREGLPPRTPRWATFSVFHYIGCMSGGEVDAANNSKHY